MAEPQSAPAGIFVTGTDTGVGKTLVTAALALFLRQQGIDVGVMKPVETGVDNPDELGPDARLLKWAAQSEDDPELISPYRFPLPLAPSVAAQETNARIDLTHITSAADKLKEKHDFLLIEGAGGLMVPLAGGLLMADLAKQIGLPLLIISRPDLGTINHTLLTNFTAHAMDIPIAGFFINNMPADPDKAAESAPKSLVSLASSDMLGVLKHMPGEGRSIVTALAQQISSLETLPWILMNFGLHHLIRPKNQNKCPKL